MNALLGLDTPFSLWHNYLVRFSDGYEFPKGSIFTIGTMGRSMRMLGSAVKGRITQIDFRSTHLSSLTLAILHFKCSNSGRFISFLRVRMPAVKPIKERRREEN